MGTGAPGATKSSGELKGTPSFSLSSPPVLAFDVRNAGECMVTSRELLHGLGRRTLRPVTSYIKNTHRKRIYF